MSHFKLGGHIQCSKVTSYPDDPECALYRSSHIPRLGIGVCLVVLVK